MSNLAAVLSQTLTADRDSDGMECGLEYTTDYYKATLCPSQRSSLLTYAAQVAFSPTVLLAAATALQAKVCEADKIPTRN